MTVELWIELVKIVLSAVSAVSVPILVFMTARLNNKQTTAAVKVEVVRQALEASTTNTDVKLDAIHKQVNGAMGAQMKIAAMALRRVADLSGHEGDGKVADQAEQALAQHEANA